jgi:branched-chain amino acid transport system substrate-binding protein
LAFIFTDGENFCSRKKQPIKLGFAGGLTGTLSDLGIAGRNGVILAVEEANERGGINGRQVVLITKDDKNDPEVARTVDRELIDEGVVAIVGHMTSTDDYLFRTNLPSKTQTDHLSEYITAVIDLKSVSAVYDLSNRAFSGKMYNNFKESYYQLGGTLVGVVTFTSGVPESFLIIAKQLLSNKPDGIFIITGSLDAALLCQQIRKIDSDITIISSTWAMAPDLIKNGGPAVEGIIFSQPQNTENQSESYKWFIDTYRARFGNEPSFVSAYGYESARIIIDAFSIDDSPERLKFTILDHNVYNGLLGDLEIDRFGDALRKRYISTVKNGKFVLME